MSTLYIGAKFESAYNRLGRVNGVTVGIADLDVVDRSGGGGSESEAEGKADCRREEHGCNWARVRRKKEMKEGTTSSAAVEEVK